VNFSPAFKWFIAILLPLTLAWKLVGIGYAEDTTDLKNKIVEVLLRRQYEVATSDHVLRTILLIRATKGSCRLVIAKASAFGDDRDYIRHLAGSAAETTFIVFRGKVYAEQPVWATALSELWWHLLRKCGFSRRVPAVLAVAATTACAAQQLPWSEVFSEM
jgi:NAD-dependent oxidoreductase involved in siderophore biosynthesis